MQVWAWADFGIEPVLKSEGGLFSHPRPLARRDEGASPQGAVTEEQRSRRLWARKPSGRRLFWRWPALARSSQPAAGMLGTRRLGHRQNPSPQAPFSFQNRLLEPTHVGCHFLTDCLLKLLEELETLTETHVGCHFLTDCLGFRTGVLLPGQVSSSVCRHVGTQVACLD